VRSQTEFGNEEKCRTNLGTVNSQLESSRVTRAHPEILSVEDSALWRKAYLEAFVDSQGYYYRRYIGSPRQFSDGIHYEGYLWDCLRAPTRITQQAFRHELATHDELLVMADDHSRDRIIGPPLWPFPPYSVARFKPALLIEWLATLPEDIYVFDSTVTWTLVLTHEYDEKRRYCLRAGLIAHPHQ
jgi:hypothetical protein